MDRSDLITVTRQPVSPDNTRALTLAATLRRILGLADAIKYAERIARMDGPLSPDYSEAAYVLRMEDICTI